MDPDLRAAGIQMYRCLSFSTIRVLLSFVIPWLSFNPTVALDGRDFNFGPIELRTNRLRNPREFSLSYKIFCGYVRLVARRALSLLLSLSLFGGAYIYIYNWLAKTRLRYTHRVNHDA